MQQWKSSLCQILWAKVSSEAKSCIKTSQYVSCGIKTTVEEWKLEREVWSLLSMTALKMAYLAGFNSLDEQSLQQLISHEISEWDSSFSQTLSTAV